MRFNRHFEQQGRHAFFSASKGHWIRYNPEKVRLTIQSHRQSVRGSRLHELAKEAILLGVKLAGNRSTISQYVNDAIGFRMSPEVVLYVTEASFGTADAIGFREEVINEDGEVMWVLRIADLKTGTTRTSFDQLKIYAAYFCLEYKKDPYQMGIIIRIYQNNEFKEEIVDPAEVKDIMEQTIAVNAIYDAVMEEEEAQL